MTQPPLTAEALLKDVLAQAVTAPLKAAKFRKSGRSYHRRHGQTVQVVNIQGSQGSTWDEKLFYVNVGVAFDEICRLAGIEVLERPKEYECDDRGTRDRLEGLIAGVPACWVLRAGESVTNTVSSLSVAVRQVIAELDQIDGLSRYRAHRWFNRRRPRSENAQVLYLLGDLTGAEREVQSLAALFADRRNADSVDWWIDRLHLTGLKDRPNS